MVFFLTSSGSSKGKYSTRIDIPDKGCRIMKNIINFPDICLIIKLKSICTNSYHMFEYDFSISAYMNCIINAFYYVQVQRFFFHMAWHILHTYRQISFPVLQGYLHWKPYGSRFESSVL